MKWVIDNDEMEYASLKRCFEMWLESRKGVRITDVRTGVMWLMEGVLVMMRAAEFWTSWSLRMDLRGGDQREGSYSSHVWCGCEQRWLCYGVWGMGGWCCVDGNRKTRWCYWCELGMIVCCRGWHPDSEPEGMARLRSWIDCDGKTVRLCQGWFGADEEHLCFIAVKFEKAAGEPGFEFL